MVTSAVQTSGTHLRGAPLSQPLQQFQWVSCQLIIVAYFLSVWKYKTWFLTTIAACGLAAFLIVVGAVKLRGIVADLWPLVFYFGWLLVASTQSVYAAEARYWSIVDSAGIAVAALFWIAARNVEASQIRSGFRHVALIATPVAIIIYHLAPGMSRLGGYALSFYPIAVPFLWTDLITGVRRRQALIALTAVFGVLLVSRSRTPLVAGVGALGLSLFWIGRTLLQRMKFATILLVVFILLGAGLVSMKSTRLMLLTFVARITHEDVITSEFYVRGEPKDMVRVQLKELERELRWEAQPFGLGYSVAGRYYERRHGEFTPFHSMYATWLVEGGIVCALIMAAILIRHFRALLRTRAAAVTADDEAMARSITIATIAALLIGLFHQMHTGPLLYALFGLALGFRRRVVVKRRAFVQARAERLAAQE